MSDESRSKDRFFEQLGILSDQMIDAHGKDFTMGALVLAARFIAEGKPVGRPPGRRVGTMTAGIASSHTVAVSGQAVPDWDMLHGNISVMGSTIDHRHQIKALITLARALQKERLRS